MFACSECGKFTPLPTCIHCGRAFETVDGPQGRAGEAVLATFGPRQWLE